MEMHAESVVSSSLLSLDPLRRAVGSFGASHSHSVAERGRERGIESGERERITLVTTQPTSAQFYCNVINLERKEGP